MISELSKKISSYLVLNGTDESEASVLAYGAECFINLLISDGLLVEGTPPRQKSDRLPRDGY
ncbi:hypothetical protein SDC9_59624 [bioreactor metagenome]|uniref:Uncharacterized protein n=1 Tax=bioreactor metagenome TaxID=1076179 RepID=A0A644XBV6_9ZZZZ